MISERLAWHPNAIEAAYSDMRNRGQFYVGGLASGPIFIDNWRKAELALWEKHQARDAEILQGLERRLADGGK